MEEDPGNNDFDSACSTPFVSAPSSPGRGFFYSAPASPIHFMLSNSSSYLDSSGSSSSTTATPTVEGFGFGFGFEFEGSVPAGSMSSADELFLNGQIRPMKLSSHLERPQVLAPLLENELSDDENNPGRGRDSKLSSRSRRRARSMSPMRTNNAFQWLEDSTKEKLEEAAAKDEVKTEDGASSVGRTSKRWVFLKEFLYRSKSEGRSSSTNGNHKFWSSSKKSSSDVKSKTATEAGVRKAVVNGASGKRRVARSPHELHYTTNRAQAEELRRKTYLPYKQGLLGCLGFSSKSYGAMNGFARALNPVSSR